MGADVAKWEAIPGETPIDPSHLKDRSTATRLELCRAEALNVRKAISHESVVRNDYLTALRRADDGDFGPLLALHAKHAGR
jgi:hypothetical protein